MISRRDFFRIGAVTAVGYANAARPILAQTATREITKIAGVVYRFRNNNHYSIFAVAPAGIIATAPINADTAQGLKAEFRQRFNQPVKEPDL